MKNKVFDIKMPEKKYAVCFLLAAVIYSVLAAALYKSGIGCVWKHILGFECPGCGMTRAAISCLKLDFAAAFGYHHLFWLMPFVVLYAFFNGKVFSSKRLNTITTYIFAALFALDYFIKLL